MGQPAILTVDDDPSVSRAIARDLRRRYGADYRIIRASSAAEALEDARGRATPIVATCPFVTGYLERHPEYQNLLATQQRTSA